MKIKLNLEVPTLKVGDCQTTEKGKLVIELDASLEEIKALNEHFRDVIKALKEGTIWNQLSGF